MKSAATEPETEPPNCDDPTAGFEFPPQTVDMRINGATVIRQLGMPDSRHDLFTGEHRLRLTRKKAQQIKFFCCQNDKPVAEVNFPPGLSPRADSRTTRLVRRVIAGRYAA